MHKITIVMNGQGDGRSSVEEANWSRRDTDTDIDRHRHTSPYESTVVLK